MATSGPREIKELLKSVSRSFHTTLRVLPLPLRRPIGLAYLLARATDTIADTELVPPERRLELLRALQRRVAGDPATALDLVELGAQQATAGERQLLNHLPELLTELTQLPLTDQGHIREVIGIITSGQVLDLERFGRARPNTVTALATAAELDDYTYRVAGCVGEFWTRLCQEHLFRLEGTRLAFMLRQGVRFGQGLQLVNILRDLPVDLRAGRCYLPAEQLAQNGLSPKELLDPETEPRLRPVYDRWLCTARENLFAGWEYTNAIPWRCFRLRLACAWPILIGLDTLEKLASQRVLDPSRRIKTSRTEVRALMTRSTLALPWPGVWRRLARSSSKTLSGTDPYPLKGEAPGH